MDSLQHKVTEMEKELRILKQPSGFQKRDDTLFFYFVFFFLTPSLQKFETSQKKNKPTNM